MAQQIIIDIVAETKKLTQGLDDANQQIGGLNKQLGGMAKAAAAAASAFVIKEGISFLKQGIEEAQDARIAMNNAVSAFGKGSAALKKITADAEKFGKALAVDNDDLIKLSTRLGTYLPPAAKKLSAEIVNLGYDISALTGVDIESWTTKFAKGMADGELKASDLEKMVPGLTSSIYKQAEAAFKAGDAQGALNLLIEEGQKAYGDAAEKNVTSSQKFNVALANLKEQIGTKVLPFVEKLVDILVKLIDLWDKQPELLKNVELGLALIVGIGGPLLTFFASAKAALVTLGIVAEGAAVSTGILSVALRAIPILAVISLIVLLVQNWDTISAKAKEVAGAVAEWFGNIYNTIKDVVNKVIDWVKQNWPLLLGILTGPFGLFVAWLIKHKDDVIEKAKDIWNGIKDAVAGIKTLLVNTFKEPFNDFYNFLVSIKDKMVNAATDIGRAIPQGIANGITSMTNWFKMLLTGWVNSNIPYVIRKALGIASPSKVMIGIGKNITEGLYMGMGLPGAPGINIPSINVSGAGVGAGIYITINAGVGTDPYELGRSVSTAIDKYSRVSVNAGRYTEL